jgi:hypothetical protein
MRQASKSDTNMLHAHSVNSVLNCVSTAFQLHVAIALVVLMATPAFGDDTPFATPPLPPPGHSDDVYSGSLGDIMELVQLRHIKLWYAAKNNNWDLANYELGQIKDTFSKAAMFYRDIPIDYIISVEKSLVALNEASRSKDNLKFARGFVDLTAACNGCHQAAKLGFITIETPTSSPFNDQKFGPIPK